MSAPPASLTAAIECRFLVECLPAATFPLLAAEVVSYVPLVSDFM